MNRSVYLNERGVKGVLKFGVVFIPGSKELDMPSFLDVAPLERLDTALAPLPPAERRDLNLLMSLIGFLPHWAIVGFVGLLVRSTHFPGPIGNLLRVMYLGLKGLVCSLYYSSPGVLQKMGYSVSVKKLNSAP